MDFNSSILKIKNFKCKEFYARLSSKQKAEPGLRPNYFAFHKPSPSSLPHWFSSRRPWNNPVPIWTMNNNKKIPEIIFYMIFCEKLTYDWRSLKK